MSETERSEEVRIREDEEGESDSAPLTNVDELGTESEAGINIAETAVARRLRTYSEEVESDGESAEYDIEAPTALAVEMTPSGMAPSVVVTAPPGSKPGDTIIIDQREIIIPPGIEAGESFVVAQRAPVVARPAPRAETTENRSIRNLGVNEQKLLNFRWSTKCFTAFDLSTTLLLALYGSWSIAALVFLIGPVYGYIGARDLHLPSINRYLIFSILKVVFVILFVIFRSYLAFFILMIQIWFTYAVLRFRILLGSISQDRLDQLSRPENQTQPPDSLIFF